MANTFKLDKDYGPKPLRKIHQELVKAINERTPLEGLGGVKIEQVEDGRRISFDVKKKDSAIEAGAIEAGGGSGGGGGTASDIYGSLNGQPAVFHLSQTADPELVT